MLGALDGAGRRRPRGGIDTVTPQTFQESLVCQRCQMSVCPESARAWRVAFASAPIETPKMSGSPSGRMRHHRSVRTVDTWAMSSAGSTW